jgi:L-iditol 2-dehydrogenase
MTGTYHADASYRIKAWLTGLCRGHNLGGVMQVARLYRLEDIRIEDEPRPELGPSDILVRTRACGICSGDVMPWYIERKAPLVPGHEPVGVVEETGAEVRSFKPGERIFVHHHAPCLSCAACRRGHYVHCPAWRSSKIVPGGMAEYFIASEVNQRDSLRLPEALGDLDAVLLEPTACVVKSLRRSGLKPGESVVIIGLGIMGMLHVRLARQAGAGLIIAADLLAQRAARARKLGADFGLVVSSRDLPDQVREITRGAMADVVIVGPGTTEAITTGVAAAGKGGTVIQFTATPPEAGLALNPYSLYFDEIRLVPSYSCGPDDTREALRLLERRVVTAADFVTHHFPLTRVREAFEMARKPEALKVAITFAQ